MRAWMFQIGQRYDQSRTTEATYENCLEEAVLAESLGFNGVWAAEHHFSNYAIFPNPLLYLAGLARETSTLRLGTMAVVLPMHNPIRVAEEGAMVDQLSGGRLEIGLARGYTPFEYKNLGADFADTQTLMDEGVEILQKYWANDDVEHHGKHWDIDQLTIVPRPRQAAPPIWYACGSGSSIEKAFVGGMNPIQSQGIQPMSAVQSFSATLHEKAAELQVPADKVRYGLQTPARLTSSAADQERAGEQVRWMYKLAGSFGTGRQVREGGYVTETGEVPNTDRPAAELTQANLIGSESKILETVAQYKEYGVTDLSLNFEFGDITSSERRESMHAFAEILDLKNA